MSLPHDETSLPPDEMSLPHDVSERLSDLLDDIGVNERIREKRKRHGLLQEKIGKNCKELYNGYTIDVFYFGSRTEGSTTTELFSDTDMLFQPHTFHVVQSKTKRKPCDAVLMMIQNENIMPGYCYLQYISIPEALLTSADGIISREHFVTDRGKLLLKNTYKQIIKRSYATLNGPAFSFPREHGFSATDFVVGFYCETSPFYASSWLNKQTECTWPSEDVMKSCRNAGCFVVPVGSKVSKRPELEWRVSTCLQERYLMFSLNITQLRCYVLMKMVIKTYINPHIEDVLTSFVCKNVLFFCIAESSYEWHRGSLLSNLHTCLLKLKDCVEQSSCPHFMIPENNLLAGKMTDKERWLLLDIFNNLMKYDEHLLFGIDIDNLGRRLKMKLNMISPCPNIISAEVISMHISSVLLCNTARVLTEKLNTILYGITHGSLELAKQYLSLKHAFLNDFHMPLVSSTLGSVMAALYIKAYTAISGEVFTYLKAGLESDALSGKLKLASVLYCTGDFEKTENILKTFLEYSDMLAIQSVCGCYDEELSLHDEFKKASNNHNEEGIKFLIAFCTRFLRCEINCVPHELRYEIGRSYTEGCWRRTSLRNEHNWMELIVVDSVPYLYFLQYKVYGQLERRGEQQQALNNLELNINCMLNLRHRETALNLLGQCLEQENKQSEAFACYIRSLKDRRKNNAARLLMCIQLLKLRKKYNLL